MVLIVIAVFVVVAVAFAVAFVVASQPITVVAELSLVSLAVASVVDQVDLLLTLDLVVVAAVAWAESFLPSAVEFVSLIVVEDFPVALWRHPFEIEWTFPSEVVPFLSEVVSFLPSEVVSFLPSAVEFVSLVADFAVALCWHPFEAESFPSAVVLQQFETSTVS